jgi:hypothetical protein
MYSGSGVVLIGLYYSYLLASTTENMSALIADIVAEEELYDQPEDLTKQTLILNRYCFWYHKRNSKQAVSLFLNTCCLASYVIWRA